MVLQPQLPSLTRKDVQNEDKPWCSLCGTDMYLNYESVDMLPHRFDVVDVNYVCAKCECFYGHLVPTATMDKGILREFRIPYINATIEGYFHCGEAMTPSGERMPPHHARMGPHQDSWQPTMRSPMRVVRCRCGFQMEIPLDVRGKPPQ